MKTTKFSKNWNNKLNCISFTTIRYWQNQFKLGEIREIELNGKLIKECEVIDLRIFKLSSLTAMVTFTDADLPVSDFKNLKRTMYKNKPVPPDEADFVLVLFRTTKVYQLALD